MNYKSIEDLHSQALYELNKENIANAQKLYSIEANKISFKNIKLFFSYLFNGGFSRIKRRAKLRRNLTYYQSSYSLKEYDFFPKKKIVVYTCIWGKYDKILEPYYINPDIDYYIFTDQEVPSDSVWKKSSIPDDVNIEGKTPIEVNRFLKINPHLLFPEYDYSIYVDGNIRIVTDMMPLIADLGEHIFGVHDYQVDCIYDMAKAIIVGKRAKRKDVMAQVKKYKKEGFPKHFGAYECNVLIRKHNDPMCKYLMEKWWEEFQSTTSKRDQLSLPYVLWKKDIDKNLIFSLGNHVRENPRFIVLDKHI